MLVEEYEAGLRSRDQAGAGILSEAAATRSRRQVETDTPTAEAPKRRLGRPRKSRG